MDFSQEERVIDGRSEIKDGMKNKKNENGFSQSVVQQIIQVGIRYSYLAVTSYYLGN